MILVEFAWILLDEFCVDGDKTVANNYVKPIEIRLGKVRMRFALCCVCVKW